MNDPKISVAVPLYNEEKNVLELYRRLTQTLKKYGSSYELVFANDGSVDKTLELLTDLTRKDKNVRVVSLSRNFGLEAAVTAVLDHAVGETVVLMDGDLQDVPEFIPTLLDKLNEGYDVVYAEHPHRHDPLVMRLFSRLFFALVKRLASYKMPMNVGHFSAMRRPVVNVLRSLTERNRFVAGLRAWVGFRQVGIPYEKQARYAGKPNQTFNKLLKMGLDGLFSFSYIPLRLATLLGAIVTTGALLVSLNVLYQKYIAHTAIVGWSGQMLSILIVGGAQLVILGILGEYLGRIYDEVKRRPYYVIAEKIGF